MLKYELKKVILNKKFVFMMIFYVILSFLVIQVDLKFSETPSISNHNLFLEVLDETKFLGEEETYEYYSKQLEEYKEYLEILTLEEEGVFLDSYDNEIINKYNTIKENNGERYFLNRYLILSTLTSDYYNTSYKDYISEVNQQLRKMKSSDIVENMSKFYNKLEDVEVKSNESYFLDALYSLKYTNIVALILVMYVVNFLFFVDDDEQMSDVISLTRKGKNKILFHKIIAGIIIITAVYIFSSIVNIIFLATIYKIPNFLANIQSFSQYFTSPYNLNVFSFIIVSYSYLLSYILMNYLFLILQIRIFNSKFLSLMFYLIVLVISYFLSVFVLDNSSLVILKYFNLFSIGQIFEMMSKYRFFSFGSLSATLPVLSYFILFTLILICSLIIFLTTRINNNQIKAEKLSVIHFRKIRSVSLKYHEIVKAFFMEHTGKMVIALVITSLYLLYTIYSNPVSQMQKSRIEYINQYGGYITEEMEKHINTESIFWNEYSQDYYEKTQMYQNNLIEFDDFNEITKKYHEQSYEYRIFQQIEKLFYESKDYFVEKTGYDVLFSQYDYRYDNFLAFLVIIFLILILSNIFIIDRRDNEDEVYLLTKKSTKSTTRFKYLLTISFSVLLVSLLSIIMFIVNVNLIMYNYDHLRMYNSSVSPS